MQSVGNLCRSRGKSGAPEAHGKAHSHPIKVVLGPESRAGVFIFSQSQKEGNGPLFISESPEGDRICF